MIVFVLACGINAAVLFSPSTGGPLPFPNFDKLVHIAIFLAVAWTGGRIGARPGTLATVLLPYAALSEIVQATLLPQRSGDVTDLVADTVGILLGLVAARVTRGSRNG